MKKTGLLLLDKPEGRPSFFLVSSLRRKTQEQRIGHAGTLDPFATGLVVLLIGRQATRYSDKFLGHDKEYLAHIKLGEARDSYDRDGIITNTSSFQPSLPMLEEILQHFQGSYIQTPPMFSAKKVQGKRLYELARKGITIERKSAPVTIQVTLQSYTYPDLFLHIACSKGTYIRSIAQDLGERLSSFAYVHALRRTRSGPFSIDQAKTLDEIHQMSLEELETHLLDPEMYLGL